MARRKRKSASPRAVAGLHLIRRQDDMLEPVYEADPDGPQQAMVNCAWKSRAASCMSLVIVPARSMMPSVSTVRWCTTGIRRANQRVRTASQAVAGNRSAASASNVLSLPFSTDRRKKALRS
jgi:hypothetical protein